jgi:putative ABC transport system permease protein
MPAFFDIMATRPARGGAFTADQARAREHVVVISHALWQSRLFGRADILGATLTLNGEPWTVIGVMPPGFSFPAKVDLWTPQELTATERAELGSWYLGVIARLKPGVSVEAAQHDVDRLAAELAKAYPTAREGRGFNVIGLQEDLAFRVSDGRRLLQGVVIVVLLIACANVANLLLAQASSRGRELALRAAVARRADD